MFILDGYGAEYGGSDFSIMDITTRRRNKKRLAGKISATTFGAKHCLKDQIKKQSEKLEGEVVLFLYFCKKSSYNRQSSRII